MSRHREGLSPAGIIGGTLFGVFLGVALGSAGEPFERPLQMPAVRSFLGAEGFGSAAPEAPAETEQFGRLAGVWITEQEYVGPDGEWVEGPAGLWVWKYTLGGFAVSDLWLQPRQRLPAYLASLDRDYLLSSVRLFESRSGRWRQAWMANGAGRTPGQDFGTLTGTLTEGRLVMTAPPGEFGLQRVVFSDFDGDSFRWTSEYSQDGGESWLTSMRIEARRLPVR